MKKTAPSSALIPAVSDQLSNAIPIELSAPGVSAGPSVPTVTHESNSTSALMGMKAAFAGPTELPKGAATWKAGGKVNGSPAVPKSA
jgi:hypothetical protein